MFAQKVAQFMQQNPHNLVYLKALHKLRMVVTPPVLVYSHGRVAITNGILGGDEFHGMGGPTNPWLVKAHPATG